MILWDRLPDKAGGFLCADGRRCGCSSVMALVVLFSCVFGLFGVKKRSKTIKIQEKCKKYAKKFAYIKNLLYLCTRFRKRTKSLTLRGGGNTIKSATKT